jgi:serine/threonine protein kinase
VAKTRLLQAQALQALGRAAEAAEAGRLAVADYDHLIASNPRDYRTNFATLLPGAADRSQAPAPAGPEDSGFRTREFDAAPGPPDEARARGPLSEYGTGPIPPVDPSAHVPRLQETLSRGYSNARLVAQAGMSQVFWAIDSALGRPVAIKQLHPAAHANAVARFHREAVLTAQLRHPNIVEVYSFGLTDAHHLPFLVMRYYANRTLQEAIRDFYAREWDPAGFRALLEAVIATCDGLAHAHAQGLVHRDPKPANVLYGDPGEIVLADWGLVKDVRNRALEVTAPSGETIQLDNLEPGDTAVGAVVGTPAFMSPEAIRGDIDAISPASDVFSVGAMLFQVLTNGPCRQGANAAETLAAPVRRPRDVRPTVAAELDAICVRALAEAPKDRYPTVAMMADDLRGWLVRN